MEDKENLMDLYFEMLHTTKTPGTIIAKFYWELFELQPNKNHLAMFNRLIKLYGRETTFFAISDMYNMENLNHDKIYPLIAFFCKKRIESKYGKEYLINFVRLDEKVKELEKKISKQSRVKLEIADPFGEEN